MLVKIAGHNIDRDSLVEILEFIGKEYNLTKEQMNTIIDNLTPETISASYARISRSDLNVSELRNNNRFSVNKPLNKDIELSRKSNHKIVFGMGHSSVAEHVVFNIDVEGLSRLAIEYLESSRLISVTEKSQRYTKIKDYIIPEELMNKPHYKEQFINLMNKQNETYEYLYNKLIEHHGDEYKAKEDARYITSLSVQGQLGLTINARKAEQLIRRLSSVNLLEVKELSTSIYNQCSSITPSLIKYVEPNTVEDKISSLVNKYYISPQLKLLDSNIPNEYEMKILDSNNNDIKICGFLLSKYYNLGLEQIDIIMRNSHKEKAETLLTEVLEQITSRETVPRCFELLDFMFEFPISAAAFGQLKRHRMATLITKPYNIDIPNTIPQSIIDIGEEELFKSVIKETNRVYRKLCVLNNVNLAEYCLTQSHNRMVILKMNLREIFNFCLLRLDSHAQWDIRSIAAQMKDLIKDDMPITSKYLLGKDSYVE